MAKKSMIAKQQRTPKFAVRAYTRVCLRKMANEGLLPGVRKASW